MDNPLNKRQSLLLILMMLAGLTLRVLCIPELPTTWDEVDFTSALANYDIIEHSPHFPGYPAYVLACRCFASFFSEKLALALPGIIATLALTFLFTTWTARRFGPEKSLRCAFLLSFSPILIVEAARPMSDTLAMSVAAIVWVLFLKGEKKSLVLGAVFLGILPAIKADHGLLWALALLAPKESRPRVCLVILGTFIAWQVLFFSIVDWELWWAEGQFFVKGHFTDWGGSTQTTKASTFERFTKTIEIFGKQALNLSTSLTLLLSFVACYFGWKESSQASRSLAQKTVLCLAPMILWTVFAQNLDHPRHIISILPYVFLGIAVSLGTRGTSQLCFGVLAAALVFAVPKNIGQTVTRPGVQEINNFLKSARWKDTNRDQIVTVYVGESARLLEIEHPLLDIRRARTWSAVKVDLESSIGPPDRVYVSSEVEADCVIPHRLIFNGFTDRSYRLLLLRIETPTSELPLPSDH